MTRNHQYFNRDYKLWTLDSFQREYVEPFPTQKQAVFDSLAKSLISIKNYDRNKQRALKACELFNEMKQKKVR
jgi:hypothetical protein